MQAKAEPFVSLNSSVRLKSDAGASMHIAKHLPPQNQHSPAPLMFFSNYSAYRENFSFWQDLAPSLAGEGWGEENLIA
jgi:hypothetical protein